MLAAAGKEQGLNYALPCDEAQSGCFWLFDDHGHRTQNSTHKMSYRTIGKSNRDDEKIVLRELVPMLACRNSSGAGLSAS
jgi:hypothetical protein